MSIFDIFKSQLSSNPPVTEDIISRLYNPTYFNGESIKDGDVVLTALQLIESDNKTANVSAINLAERHLDLFESPSFDKDPPKSLAIPTIKLKEED